MMKRSTILILGLFCLSVAASAQLRQFDSEPRRTSLFPGLPQQELEERVVADTLIPAAFADECSEFLTVYGISNEWGTVTGMNGYFDLEKAQLIENITGTAIEITEVLAYFDYIGLDGNGNLRAKIYSVAEDGSPSTLLGQSDDITASEVMADPTEILVTSFPFTSTVSLSDASFFVSVDFTDLYASQDTTGLLQTEIGCGDGNESFELWADETWHSMAEVWSSDTETFDIHLPLFPVVEFDETSPVADPFYQQGHLRLRPATPNPAHTSVQLNYELEQSGTVRIEIFSPDGRRIQERNLGLLPQGNYVESVELGNLASGAYIYSILTEEARVVSRFVVE